MNPLLQLADATGSCEDPIQMTHAIRRATIDDPAAIAPLVGA